jgi:hypothetical protein
MDTPPTYVPETEEELIQARYDEQEAVYGFKAGRQANTCPVCSQPAMSRCNCDIASRRCINNHEWHWKVCDKVPVLVMGSGH